MEKTGESHSSAAWRRHFNEISISNKGVFFIWLIFLNLRNFRWIYQTMWRIDREIPGRTRSSLPTPHLLRKTTIPGIFLFNQHLQSSVNIFLNWGAGRVDHAGSRRRRCRGLAQKNVDFPVLRDRKKSRHGQINRHTAQLGADIIR